MMSSPVPAPRRSPRRFDYCRFIELDYVPMESGHRSHRSPTKARVPQSAPPLPSKAPPLLSRAPPPPRSSSPRSGSPLTTRGSRRTAPPRDTHSCSSSSGSCKGSDCSPTKGRQLRSCSENHGIRPPPPEQYLTPLQQKEVCIRHLRTRLRETIGALETRDGEIGDLRQRLSQMQEDWVEEECQRVEAQLALKEARAEIQALQRSVGGVTGGVTMGGVTGGVAMVGSELGAEDIVFQDLAPNGRGVARAAGSAPASVSVESPVAPPTAPLTRSSTYTRLSEQENSSTKHHDRDSARGHDYSGHLYPYGHLYGDIPLSLLYGDTPLPLPPGSAPQATGSSGCVPSRADLLLEAAFLSEETASLLNACTQTFASLPPLSHSHTLPHSFPRSRLARPLPHSLSHSSTCEGGLGGCCSRPCRWHHPLVVREAGIQTEGGGACSPASTWSDESGCTALTMATEPLPQRVREEGGGLARSKTICALEGEEREEGEELDEDKADDLDLTYADLDDLSCYELTPLTMLTTQPQTTQPLMPPPLTTQPLTTQPLTTQPLTTQPLTTQPLTLQSKHLPSGEISHAANTQDAYQANAIYAIANDANTTSTYAKDVANPSCASIGEANTHVDNSSSGRVGEANAHVTFPSCANAHVANPSCASMGEASTHVTNSSDTSVDEANTHVANSSDTSIDEADAPVANPSCASVSEDNTQELEVEELLVPERSYWSRHFLVDLLAVMIPVVPTVAWWCRGSGGLGGGHVYHLGSLMRGCCSVALHSLRRGRGAGGGGAGGGGGNM